MGSRIMIGHISNKKSWFAIAALYSIHFIAKSNEVLLFGDFSFYIGDLLCIPLVLGLTLILMQIIYSTNQIRVSTSQIIITVIIFSLMFEWVLPKYLFIGTSDPKDIFMYVIGGFMFYYFFNPKPTVNYMA
jgi:hypothetical protein